MSKHDHPTKHRQTVPFTVQGADGEVVAKQPDVALYGPASAKYSVLSSVFPLGPSTVPLRVLFSLALLNCSQGCVTTLRLQPSANQLDAQQRGQEPTQALLRVIRLNHSATKRAHQFRRPCFYLRLNNLVHARRRPPPAHSSSPSTTPNFSNHFVQAVFEHFRSILLEFPDGLRSDLDSALLARFARQVLRQGLATECLVTICWPCSVEQSLSCASLVLPSKTYA